MPDQAPRVSIVIPALNEAARLPASIREIRRVFPDQPWEFLIVIELGTDDTEAVSREAAAGDGRFKFVINPTARGKGYAVKTGMLLAQGEVVFFMDADLSVPLRFIPSFLQEAGCGGVDVLIGSRQHGSSVIAIRQSLSREIAGRLFNLALRLAGVTRFADTQCGFKAFRREAAWEIFSRVRQNGFGFDVEALAIAEALGFRVVELPVEWSDAPGSKLRPLRDGVSALCDAVLAASRIRRNDYKKCQSLE
ncbi:MAG: glycosyltransferase family 2 protein [Verrucomicrobiaceae bacterium]|nr:MAG: glycosyltransferase family 2 protein [Verrucomicrobiaceae bacterium]